MCGINGIFSFKSGSAPVDEGELLACRDAMTARGPDGAGLWISPDRSIGLAHRRLAIIDISADGAQPMTSATGNLVVTFNGEIYNYLELRRELERKGYVFKSHSDTEVLLHLFAEKGEDMVHDLRGMFAFAIWDATRQSLFLARDPYGIKPLYYSAAGGQFTFASSVKALVTARRIDRAADPAGVLGFFVFGSVPEPWTIYRAVRALPAGSMLCVDRNGVQAVRRYHSIAACLAEAEIEAARSGPDSPSAVAALREALLDSVRQHLVADVPVGAFLSAGVDSSALVGLMRDAGQADIQTITLAFDEFEGQLSDESPLAEKVARHYATRHTTRRIGSKEFEQDLPRILSAMDQPSIDGINTWFVSKAAREVGMKVAISGVGGDELLGGYSTFKSVPQLSRRLSVPARIAGGASLASKLVGVANAVGFDVHPKFAGLLRYGGSLPGAYLLQRGLFLPEEAHGLITDHDFLTEGLNRLAPIDMIQNSLAGGPVSEFGRMMVLESSFYMRNQLLRDTDWASMAHSLEVRTPFVDHILLRRSAAIMLRPECPDGKSMLAAAPGRPIPYEVATREKTGFSIPVEAWLENASPRNAATPRHAVFSRRWAQTIAGANEDIRKCGLS